MIRFAKIYQEDREKKKKEPKPDLNREGYGYIKRRVGLLSSEVGKPTYTTEREIISNSSVKPS